MAKRGAGRTVAVVAAAAALLAGCSSVGPSGGGSADGSDGGGGSGVGKLQLIAALAPFDACDDFLSWVKAAARERVESWGLPGAGGPGWLDIASAGGVAESKTNGAVAPVA